tara:strand:- start:962 stop:2050 length:1089 start_codon:yes stop_codon:yes gene_type:complete
MPLKVSDGIGAWIDDFQQSKDKRFDGHSKKKRREQGIAAYLSAKKGPLPNNENTNLEENPLMLLPTVARVASRINPSTIGSAAATVGNVVKKGYETVKSKLKKKTESSSEYAKSIERINKQKRNAMLKPGEKDKIDKIRDMMKKANENVRSADRKPEVYTKPDGRRGVRMVPTDREVIKKRMQMNSTNENVKEGMTTGNETGMMFRVKIEGLPDMIMVGRSPSDIKQQLRKIVKQPSMIDSVDRMPKSQVRKMYRDLAGGKDIDEAVHHIDQHDNTDTDFIKLTKKHGVKHKAAGDGTKMTGHPNNIKKVLSVMPNHDPSDFKENYLADYGSPESVKKMKDITPGQAGAMLDKLMKRRKSKR